MRHVSPAFRLLLGLNFLLWFAGYQVFPVVPLHLRDLGASLAESGRFAAFLTVGTATGALLLGRLGDRIGAAKMLRTSSLGLTLLLLAYAFPHRPWPFLLMAPLHGLLWAGMKTSAMSLAAQTLRPEQRTVGLSWFGLSGALGVALGPLAGLSVLPLLGFPLQILLTAAVFAFIGLGPSPRVTDVHAEARAQAAWPGRAILVPGILLLAWGFPQGTLAPFSAQEAKWLGQGWVSALLTCFALGMLCSRSVFGLLGRGMAPMRLLPTLLAGGILAMAALGFLPGALLRHMIGGFLFGASLGLAHTLLFAQAMARSGPRRGEAVGLMYLAYEMGMGLGAATVGPAMEAAARRWNPAQGFRTGWVLAAAPLLLAFPLAWWARRSQNLEGGLP